MWGFEDYDVNLVEVHVSHSDEGELGRPMADIVWSGLGGTYISRYTTRYRDGDTTWTETYSSTERTASMGGTNWSHGLQP